jgi:hypothetical protein
MAAYWRVNANNKLTNGGFRAKQRNTEAALAGNACPSRRIGRRMAQIIH